jgi:hypothetical protein
VGGCGNQYVWDDSNGNSTIIGSSGNNTVVAFSHTIADLSSDGTNEFYAAGSNTTLIGGAGTNVFNILNNVTNTDCTIYGGTNTVIGNSGLLNLSVSSGDVTLDSGSGNEIITISPNALGGELNIYSYSPSECTLESLGSTESILVPNASSWTYGVETIKDGGFTITLHK